MNEYIREIYFDWIKFHNKQLETNNEILRNNSVLVSSFCLTNSVASNFALLSFPNFLEGSEQGRELY